MFFVNNFSLQVLHVMIPIRVPFFFPFEKWSEMSCKSKFFGILFKISESKIERKPIVGCLNNSKLLFYIDRETSVGKLYLLFHIQMWRKTFYFNSRFLNCNSCAFSSLGGAWIFRDFLRVYKSLRIWMIESLDFFFVPLDRWKNWWWKVVSLSKSNMETTKFPLSCFSWREKMRSLKCIQNDAMQISWTTSSST